MKKSVLFFVAFCMSAFIALNAQTTVTSWVGNTWGKTTADPNWVQNDIRGMYVVPDGTIYTASNWDEGTHECGIYSTNSTFLNALDDTHARTWYCVSVGNNYVYVGYDKGFQRYTYNGNSKDGSYVQVSTNTTIDDAAVKGLAIDPVASELYVNNWIDGKIMVYNSGTLALKRSWTFTNNGVITGVGQMAWDGTNLWAVQNKNIVKMSSTGTVLATITTVGRPDGLWCDMLGTGGTARLLVADGGPDQQIKIFSISGTPTQTSTFGDLNGILAGTPGQCASTKLDGPSAVATDAAGNIYVACRGNRSSLTAAAPGYHSNGLVLRKYSASGTMQWQRESLHFVEVATTDPNDETKVYSPYHVYSMDYSKNGNGQEWTHISSTINASLYPYDARIATPDMMTAKADVRTINGNKYLYMTFFETDMFAIYKMEGQIAKPCVVRGDESLSPFFPNSPTTAGYWYWQDNNGDGQMDANEYRFDGNVQITGTPEANGKLWKCTWDTKSIEYITLNSINAYGVPIYSSTPTAEPYSGTLSGNVTRVLYLPTTDVMYLAGAGAGYDRFTKVIKYTNWSGTRTAAWTITQPNDNIALDVAGSYVFLGTDNGQGMSSSTYGGSVDIFNDSNGAKISTLNATNTSLGGMIGIFDFGQCISVKQRTNDEYLIFAEDDGYHKSVLWRWCPTGECSASDIKVQLTAPVNGEVFIGNSPILLEAEVTSDTSEISKVEFYINDTLIGESVTLPYHFSWNKPYFGNIKCSVKVTATQNSVKYSPFMFFNVIEGLPEVQLNLTKTTYSPIDSIVLIPIIKTYNSSVDSVIFYLGNTVLFTDTDSVYSFTWKNLPAGAWDIKVKVVDKSGKAGWSQTIPIKVDTWTVIDDTDQGWTWSGYAFDVCTTCYNVSAHSTDKVDDYGLFTFAGTDLEAYCETWDGGGSIEVFIDGVSKGLFSQAVAPYGGANIFAKIGGLTNQVHIVKFVSVSANWTGIDFIRYASDINTGSYETKDESTLVMIYPNPARNFVNINFANNLNNELCHIKIVDISGKIVYEAEKTSGISKLNLHTCGISKGVYILKISVSGDVINKKLIIN